MSIKVDWGDEKKTSIIITFNRPWDWAEFHVAYEQMDSLFKSVSHEIDLILDITEGGFPPGGAVQEFKRVSENRHANLGKIIVVGIPFFFRGMLNILRSVYAGRYEAPNFLFAANMEKAREMLTLSSEGKTATAKASDS